MKLLLVAAFLCIGLASGAHIRRLTRETEAVIPQLVEEILKVELQSDLKQNNKVEVAEVEPVIKKIADEAVAEGMVKEGEPIVVEIIKDEPVLAVLKTEPLTPEVPAPVIKEEKIEVIIKDNLDTFRDEAAPMAPAAVEPLKEAIIAEVKVDEAKMEQPALRNVVKEEIPQVEELRNIAPVEKEAVKESLPEPVVALTVAEPVLLVEEAEKTVAVEPVLKKLEEETVVKAEKTEVIPEKVEIIEEKKEETLAKSVPVAPVVPVVPEMAIPAEIPVIAEIKEETPIKAADTPIVTEVKEIVVEVKKLAPEATEAKPVEKIVEVVPAAAVAPVESEIPAVEMIDPEVRQSQNNPLQQAISSITQGVTSFVSNVPIISNLVGNSQNSVAADAPADAAPAEAVADESNTTARPQFPILQGLTENIQSGFQTFGQNVQNFGQNVVNSVQGLIPNAASSSETAQPGPLASLAQSLGLRPATAAPAKEDDKPVEIPTKVEGEKAPEAAKTAAVEVVEKQPEEKKPVEVVAPAIAEVVAPTIVEEKDSIKIEKWTKTKHL